eukprot:374736_1
MRAFNFNRLLSAIIVILLQHATVSTQYILVEQHALYTEASEYCQATYGTFLASIHSWDDNYQAQLACKDSCPSCSSNWRHGCFIGLNDILNERNTDKTGWVWQDGSAFDFSEAWRGSEPNNYGGAEDCVFIFGSDHLTIDYRGKWADVPCESGDFNSYASYFLCNDPQTRNPSAAPTNIPTNNPSMPPSTAIPSPGPTNSPSHNPSVQPTTHPSHNPSHNPSKNPSKNPSAQPTIKPSKYPTVQATSNIIYSTPADKAHSVPEQAQHVFTCEGFCIGLVILIVILVTILVAFSVFFLLLRRKRERKHKQTKADPMNEVTSYPTIDIAQDTVTKSNGTLDVKHVDGGVVTLQKSEMTSEATHDDDHDSDNSDCEGLYAPVTAGAPIRTSGAPEHMTAS